jgi:hypothetical protein
MCFKNFWKNRSYAVKGGIIGALIYLVPSVLASLYFMFFGSFLDAGLWPMFIFLPSTFFLLSITNADLFFVLCLASNTLIYYLIGALIGKIVQKVKSKNKRRKK